MWVWLPGALEPVAAGRLDQDRDVLVFTYGRRYLARDHAISLFLPELPLGSGPQLPMVGVVAGCIRDAAPDGWGQRVIENRLVGPIGANTDDHARNHAGFWNGHELALTPAYDLSPWLRSGGETLQSMIIDRDGHRDSRLVRCLEAANIFHLDRREARAIIDNQISIIEGDWDQVCEEALLKRIDRKRLRNSAVLHPSTKYGY